MKRLALLTSLALLCAAVRADELGDAQRHWDNKDFAAAFRGFSALAERGNVPAQLQLGEMYGFGEGTPQDLKQALYWLDKARAAGHPDAAESLLLVQQRTSRQADIQYYTTSFDGARLRYETYGCVRPVIPALSQSNDDIKAVNAAVASWAACYGRFVAGLSNSLPATRTIPPDIIKIMNNDEFSRAAELIVHTCQAISVKPQELADEIMSENKAWKSATELYVAQNNTVIKEKAEKDRLAYDNFNREVEEALRRKNDAANSKKTAPVTR